MPLFLKLNFGNLNLDSNQVEIRKFNKINLNRILNCNRKFETIYKSTFVYVQEVLNVQQDVLNVQEVLNEHLVN